MHQKPFILQILLFFFNQIMHIISLTKVSHVHSSASTSMIYGTNLTAVPFNRFVMILIVCFLNIRNRFFNVYIVKYICNFQIYARQIVLITYPIQLIISRHLSFVIALPVFICKADSSIKFVEMLRATAWHHITFFHTPRITLVPDK